MTYLHDTPLPFFWFGMGRLTSHSNVTTNKYNEKLEIISLILDKSKETRKVYFLVSLIKLEIPNFSLY